MEYKKDGEEPSGVSMPNSEVHNSIFITNNGTLFLDEKFAEKYGLTLEGNVLKIREVRPEAPVGNNMENTPICNTRERNEDLFHFIHPELDETEARRIHNAVKRVVKRQGIQMICLYLMQLKGEKKVLLPPNPSVVYIELVRTGMPDGEGFNETTFRKYYNKPIAPNAI